MSAAEATDVGLVNCISGKALDPETKLLPGEPATGRSLERRDDENAITSSGDNLSTLFAIGA